MTTAVSACDFNVTGVVANFPNRRACHPRLFFIELQVDPRDDGLGQVVEEPRDNLHHQHHDHSQPVNERDLNKMFRTGAPVDL